MRIDLGMTNLASYREAAGETQEEFGLRVGASQATISKLERGMVAPSLELAVAIERATAGAVPAVSWVPDKSGEAA